MNVVCVRWAILGQDMDHRDVGLSVVFGDSPLELLAVYAELESDMFGDESLEEDLLLCGCHVNGGIMTTPSV